MTPVKFASPVSSTLVNEAFTVLESFFGVYNTAEEFLTCVNNTGKVVIYQCQRDSHNNAKPTTAIDI
jgi:hypothetical protein